MMDNLLFIADQHHLNNLESLAKEFGRDMMLRLIGDITPTQINLPPLYEDSTLLKDMQKAYKAKHSEDMSENRELSDREKKEAHREGIETAFRENPELALELTVMYGGASVFNLARKSFISCNSAEETLCLKGNEHLIEDAQRHIYRIIGEKQNLRENEIIPFVINQLAINHTAKFIGVLESLIEIFSSCGVKKDVLGFIRKELSAGNYGARAPTCIDVFRGYPLLENFRFVEQMHIERKNNCLVIYVPYFSEEEERLNAMASARDSMKQSIACLSRGEKLIPVIAYHGNPYPRGMEDVKTQERVDHNKKAIEAVVYNAFECSDHLDTSKGLRMVCSHLHKSNKPYEWTTDFNKKVELFPLGINDYLVLNTKSGELMPLKDLQSKL